MKTLAKTSLLMIVTLALLSADAAAQGRGRGGQQGMRGRSGAGGYNAQAAAMQRQMMQYRYRQGQSGFGARGGMGQQQQLRDGSCLNQPGYGTHGGQGRGQARGNRSQRGSIGNGGRGRGQGMQASTNLTQAEIDSLIVMREEEKLARDVYLTLADCWNVPIFANIARSETRHMTVVGQLIRANGLNDPVADDTVGSFTNPKFAQLYDELVETGSRSLNDAYQVGVTIEEMDIRDLEESLAKVSNSNVRRVYQNLLRASQNHLRAFSANQ